MTGRTIASAASQRVFGNYELLEQMLLHLPLRDLLLSQRINKACFDVVFNSHAIARALFFQPSAGVAEPVAAQCDDSWDDEWTWIRRGNGSQDRILPFLNPFLEIRESYWDEDSFLDGDYLGDSMCAMSRKMQIYDEEGFEIYEFVCRRERNGEARSSSSRDRMMVTHPAFNALEVSDATTTLRSVHGPRGGVVTIGDMLDSAARWDDPSQWCKPGVRREYLDWFEIKSTQFDRVRLCVLGLPQAKAWIRLKGVSIDTTSGYDMLKIFQMTFEQLCEHAEDVYDAHPEWLCSICADRDCVRPHYGKPESANSGHGD